MDEVGRGAWAGPFVACAVFVAAPDHCVRGVRDSNELSAGRREQLCALLRIRHQWGLGVVTVEELNTIGMARAQVVVFERAVEALLALTTALSQRERVFVDGLSIRSHPQWRAIIDGDRKVYAIAAASIIAKVERDTMMNNLHGTDGRYRFDLHKGYGTPLHRKLLGEHGPSVYHRRLFEPIRTMLYLRRARLVDHVNPERLQSAARLDVRVAYA